MASWQKYSVGDLACRYWVQFILLLDKFRSDDVVVTIMCCPRAIDDKGISQNDFDASIQATIYVQRQELNCSDTFLAKKTDLFSPKTNSAATIHIKAPRSGIS